MALRLRFMRSSLASVFARKWWLEAGFTFLTNSLRAVDHSEAYDAYIAQRKETHQMKKTIVVLVAALSIAAFAFAQEPDHPGMMMKHRLAMGMGPGSDEIASALNLSTDQKVQWDAIHSQLEASVKPLFDQHRAAEQQLQAAVDVANPDATSVGRAFLAMRAIDKQIQAAHESTHAKLTAILTPDQKAKFDAMHAKMENGPMMMRHHDGARE
jgi:Spy/CpxP family protein refolding chaperone